MNLLNKMSTYSPLPPVPVPPPPPLNFPLPSVLCPHSEHLLLNAFLLYILIFPLFQHILFLLVFSHYCMYLPHLHFLVLFSLSPCCYLYLLLYLLHFLAAFVSLSCWRFSKACSPTITTAMSWQRTSTTSRLI